MHQQVERQRQFWQEIHTRIEGYQKGRESLAQGRVQDRALTILRYLNMKWLSDGLTFEGGVDELQTWSPFPSSRTRKLINPAVGHPFIRRLQFIRQLGTTYLHQRRDAAHSRWSHGVGVAECIGQFLDALDNNNCSVKNAEDAIALAIAGLIHDALQGPWGHSLELVAGLFVPEEMLARQTRLDKLLLRAELDNPDSELRAAIEPCLGGGG